MARRYALVPESWLHEQVASPTAQSHEKPTTTVYDVQKDDTLSDIADLIPKNYRSKAKTLLHYVQRFIKLDSQQRVVYQPGNQIGSHIIDLVKYFVAPFPTERPIDAPQFQTLIEKAGVPKSALAKRCTAKLTVAKWKTIK